MKAICVACMILVSAGVFASDKYPSPIHTPEQIVAAVEKAGLLGGAEMASGYGSKIVTLSFDYIAQQWYVGLNRSIPAKEGVIDACVDCWPSVYIPNKEPLTIVIVPHG